MPRKKASLTFIEKRSALSAALDGLIADRNNGEYDYVPCSKLLIEMRRHMRALRLHLDITELEANDQQFGEKLYARVRTEYTLTDLDSKDSKSFIVHGSAWATDSTAPYKAKTGSLKYFLRNLGQVPFLYMDRDEVEFSSDAERPALPDSAYESPQGLSKDARKRLDQSQAFDIKCNQTGKTYQQRADYLKLQGVTSAGDLKKDAYGKAILWAAGMDSLESGLAESLKVVEMKNNEATQ